MGQEENIFFELNRVSDNNYVYIPQISNKKKVGKL